MKKFVIVLLAAVFAVGVVGCSKESGNAAAERVKKEQDARGGPN
jgi:hypothetical protein